MPGETKTATELNRIDEKGRKLVEKACNKNYFAAESENMGKTNLLSENKKISLHKRTFVNNEDSTKTVVEGSPLVKELFNILPICRRYLEIFEILE